MINYKPASLQNLAADELLKICKSYALENKISRDEFLALGIKECLKNGITSFHDAGSGKEDIEAYKRFINSGKLKIRLYVMLTGGDPDLLHEWFQQGPAIGLGNDFLTIRSIKLNADGALGSRGAWLLEEYEDMPGHYGMAMQSMSYIYEIGDGVVDDDGVDVEQALLQLALSDPRRHVGGAGYARAQAGRL